MTVVLTIAPVPEKVIVPLDRKITGMAKRHWNRKGDLESMFLRLEELVLANSGEDDFEEVFKLLVAKLWDERSGNEPRFFARKSEAETFETVRGLLRETENAWPGILNSDTQPRLRPEHLHVCVDALSQHSLTCKDFHVLDGFFEYLVSRGAKGSKGQYFTPRHVVEFCVQALRPTKDDIVCDPGCGSGGFLLHTLNFVQERERLSSAELREYCKSNIWVLISIAALCASRKSLCCSLATVKPT